MSKTLIPKERGAGETRVATTPETVAKLMALGQEVEIERGAGEAAHFPDEAYAASGASIVDSSGESWRHADLVLKVGALATGDDGDEVARLAEGSVVIGLLAPFDHHRTVRRLAAGGVTSLSLELLPRVTKAQSMDVLSSQANIAGYRAAVMAALRLDRYFPLLMTAAGTVRPAKVVVIGAGVAGLQALATARRLGAVVEVSDIRPEVEEQVESLGGHFIPLPETEEDGAGTGGYAREMGADFLRRQREILKQHLAAANVVITTAAVPGKPAPRIIDLAAERGGNCELTRADEEVESGGVLILGPTNLAAGMAHDASLLYARNLLALVEHLSGEDGIAIDAEDEIVRGLLLTHDGEIRQPGFAEEDSP
ncbi:MAG: NAD(P) transhydrogenase subunit alpha [Thermoanaerobaculia bacterium]